MAIIIGMAALTAAAPGEGKTAAKQFLARGRSAWFIGLAPAHLAHQVMWSYTFYHPTLTRLH
jgi:hypothetical protein